MGAGGKKRAWYPLFAHASEIYVTSTPLPWLLSSLLPSYEAQIVTKGVAANIMFLSKPKILIENCDVPWFSGPEEIIPVAIWHTRSATEF